MKPFKFFLGLFSAFIGTILVIGALSYLIVALGLLAVPLIDFSYNTQKKSDLIKQFLTLFAVFSGSVMGFWLGFVYLVALETNAIHVGEYLVVYSLVIYFLSLILYWKRTNHNL